MCVGCRCWLATLTVLLEAIHVLGLFLDRHVELLHLQLLRTLCVLLRELVEGHLTKRTDVEAFLLLRVRESLSRQVAFVC